MNRLQTGGADRPVGDKRDGTITTLSFTYAQTGRGGISYNIKTLNNQFERLALKEFRLFSCLLHCYAQRTHHYVYIAIHLHSNGERWAASYHKH